MYLRVSSRKCHFSSGNNVFRPTYSVNTSRSVRLLDVPKNTTFGVPVCGMRILFLPSSVTDLRSHQILYIMGAWKTLPEGKDSENLNLLTKDHLVDRLCGLVVRVSSYRYRGLGFDSRLYQIF